MSWFSGYRESFSPETLAVLEAAFNAAWRPTGEGGDARSRGRRQARAGAKARSNPVAGRDRADLGAIGAVGAAHPARHVAALVLHDRPAGVAAGELVGLRQILHGVARIGLGIEQAAGAAGIAHAARRLVADLHQTVIAGMRGARIVAALDADDGVGERERHAIGRGMTRDQRAEPIGPGRRRERGGTSSLRLAGNNGFACGGRSTGLVPPGFAGLLHTPDFRVPHDDRADIRLVIHDGLSGLRRL